MAKKWYWDDQFKLSLPRFLAKWYVTKYIKSIERKCKKKGISSMMKFTDGYYSVDRIGEYVLLIDKSYWKLWEILEKSKNPIVSSMFNYAIKPRQVKVTPGSAAPDHVILYQALTRELGLAIQETQWWEKNLSEIRKSAYRTRIIQKVMES